MATRKGLWDEALVPDGWFDYTLQPDGWFSPYDLDESAAAEGSGSVNGVGLLTGAGQASQGTGQVEGIGSLTGAGSASQGAGSVSGIGVLVGEGAVPVPPSEGGGSISGIGFLSGEGYAESPTATTGGGSSKRKGRRYPRKVMLRGRTYTVGSWDEELSLLQALVDRAEYTAAVEASPVEEKAAVRLKKRLKKVESERDKWIRQLRQADEELLILLM